MPFPSAMHAQSCHPSQRRWSARSDAASLLLALVGSWAGCSGSALEERKPVEVVYYSSPRPALWDIFVADSIEGTPRRVTDNLALDYNPALTADGRWLAFTSERNGGVGDIFLLDLDSASEARPLVTGPAFQDQAAFSPAGDRLAWVSDEGGTATIHLAHFQPQEPFLGEEIALTAQAPYGPLFRPAFSPDGQRLAFVAQRLGEEKPERASDIVVADLDGGNWKALTGAEGWDASPAWSTDGRLVFFHRFQEIVIGELPPHSEIWRVDVESGESSRILGDEMRVCEPHPDAQGRLLFEERSIESSDTLLPAESWRIALRDGSGSIANLWEGFFSPAPSSAGRVAMVGLGTTSRQTFPSPFGEIPLLVEGFEETRELPDRTLVLRAIRLPFPSPNPGRTAALMSVPGPGILSVDLSSGAFHPVAPGSFWAARWSPAGDWIVAADGPIFGPPEAPVHLWRMRPDGSERTDLTESAPGSNGEPNFSSDGKRIVFRSGRDGNHEIYLMNIDGSGLKRLTDNPASDRQPAFSPDGRQVAFASTRDGNYEIYTLDLDEEGNPGALRRITESPGHDNHPVYSPDGKWLLITSQRGGYVDQQPLLFNPQPYGDLFAIRLEDGYTVRLTDNPWEDGLAVWLGQAP